MQERQRHLYLSILGIENYVPRRVISGAPSPILLPNELLLDTSLLYSGQTSNPDRIQSRPENEAGYEIENAINSEQSLSATSLLDRFDEKQSQSIVGQHENSLESIQKNEPSQKNQSISQQSLDDIHSNETSDESINALPVEFVLSIWRIADDCLVIDSRQPATALPTDRLLQNIVRVMGYSLAQLPPSETIRWPFLMDKRHANKRELTQQEHANEVSQARAMVQAYITAQVSKMPIKTLLLMGENAALYSLDNTASFEQLSGSLISESTWDANIIVTPSLFSMLQEPLNKKVTWKALQNILP